ncbi:hypothetical protein W97_01401 [Coniosporium apollinis CBS 100218]|uniref:Uncharacterized protein n=1 Tax=Coniosporium apollinis (strain CBS 100218) TaxID=1168221 RepID=R7YKN7_CONA1|nr:uncharacterized protein W97_01401 [Coniosporium apollinis CBS 100218]EON62181.1 hypothetical protein W97_01401 [Coniosporium apollinis CBS 100218]
MATKTSPTPNVEQAPLTEIQDFGLMTPNTLDRIFNSIGEVENEDDSLFVPMGPVENAVPDTIAPSTETATIAPTQTFMNADPQPQNGLTNVQADWNNANPSNLQFSDNSNFDMDDSFANINVSRVTSSLEFSAVPGTANAIFGQPPMQYVNSMNYFPQHTYAQPPGHYTQYPPPDAQYSQPYHDDPFTAPMEMNPYPAAANFQAPVAPIPPATQPNHPAMVRSDAQLDSNSSDSDSAGKRRRRKAAKNPVKYKAEKPKRDAKHAWVRTNTTTKGVTTRTGKINQYDPSKVYENVPHTSDWSSSKYFHEYTEAGELVDGTFSADQLHEYLHQWSTWNGADGARLILWIQRCPTDSARRYASEGGSKCRFKHCPATNNTIMHGHYRVAFDEVWAKYKTRADPFIQAGYVHLYCLERFLDFPEICAKLDMRPDDRKMIQEPRGHWAPVLGTHDAVVAKDFIKRCKKGTLRQNELYAKYPVHDASARGAHKEHAFTLTCRMSEERNGLRPESQQDQFRGRGKSATHITQHKGNLQQIADAKAVKAGKKTNVVENPEDQVTEIQANKVASPNPPPKRAAAFKLKAPPTPRRQTKKRKAAAPDDSEGETDDVPGNRPPVKKARQVTNEDFETLGRMSAAPFIARILQGEQPLEEEFPPMPTPMQAGFVSELQNARDQYARIIRLQTPEESVRSPAVSRPTVVAEVADDVTAQLKPLHAPSPASSDTVFLPGPPLKKEDDLFGSPTK